MGSLEVATRAGVAIGFGTDLMGDLEDDQLLGLRLQSEAQSVEDLLRSVTVVNAEIIGMPELARVVGGVGDLVILSRDPLEDPSVLWDAGGRTVLQSGQLVS